MISSANQSVPVERDYERAAALSVQQQLDSIARRTDRMFGLLMGLQWIAAMAAALWLSPRSWVGTQSSVHIHVWAAVFLGGALACFPIYLATMHPGRAVTRHVIAVAQMLWSALLIHLTGGRIETHFHVFGSLAFLAWYRRPSVLLTATIVVVLDHVVRGMWWPQSVYGVAMASVWRTLEHGSWVVFEDIFLWLSIRCSLTDMRKLALHQTRMEHARDRIEEEVQLRTQELTREIAERRQVEAELAQRDEQLRQSQKLEAVGSLAGGIAHEFNNLLQAIRGYTQYAMEGLPAEDQRFQDLEQVVKASDRAATLTRELLGFSRRQVLERGNLDPGELVGDIVRLLRPLIGEQIDLQVSLAADTGSLYADRGLLQQMLLNLCINARDAMPDGGRLVLKTERFELSQRYCELHPTAKPGAYVMFSVADTGCGIPAELKERVFEPFFTTKGVGKGTGLGLAMVYGCVQQHGGTINVYSEPNRGTTFKIYLPIAAEADSVSHDPLSTPAAGGHETILIAEDEPMVRDLAVRILGEAGYSVLVAADGAAAVELFEAHASEIALVLLDAVMPKLTGHQAYDRIKLKNPNLPVVFCSGYDPEMGQVKMLVDQGVRMVQKPFDPDILLQAIREALDAQKLLETTPCTV
ncbi:MAG TPA: ATP-binding protein [Pirellulales bacterium]|nr:ATP-binding protein [Pirellulales bacterium]